MKRTTTNRLFVIWIGAAVVAWTGSLCYLWAWAFDSSGASTLVTLAATAFALAATASVPAPLSKIAYWFGVRLRLDNVGALELLARQRRPEGQATAGHVTRALSITVAFAILCGAISTIAVYGGAWAAHLLGRRMLWTPLGWTGVKLVIQFVGMLPMAIGISAVAHSFLVVRRSFGRDPYGPLCRDLLSAITVGIGVFGLLLWCGMHMPALAGLMAMLLVAAIMALSRRGNIPISRRGPVLGSGPRWRERIAISVALAVLTLILLVQGRLLGDIGNVSFGARICYWAVSLALLGVFIRRVDRKSRPPGQAQELGCAIGTVAAAMMQAALAIACCQGGKIAAFCGPLAAACQVPLMAMVAVILSRRRRLFAASGGKLKAYVSCVSTGVGIGVVTYMIVCSAPAWFSMLLAAALAVWAGQFIRRIARRQRPANERMWALAGLSLMGAVIGVLLVSVHNAKLAVGQATPGFWLSPVRRGPAAGDGHEQVDWLPIRRTWRSQRITQAIAKIIADPDNPDDPKRGHRGRWWVVAGTRRDLPKVPNPRVYEVVSVPDPAAVPPGIWQEILVRGSERDFLQAAHTGSELFDAVFLAPLPADHNQAWRCYNYQTLRRCWLRVHRRGVVLLRTQASGDNLASALAVARTFHEAVGNPLPGQKRQGQKRLDSWAVVEWHEGTIDLLLVGPARAVKWSSWREGLTVVSTEKLYDRWSEIAPIRLDDPSGRWKKRQPTPDRLHYWLRSAKSP